MKLSPRKIADKVIAIYFLVLSLVTILIFTFITMDFEMTKLSQGFYSDHSISFKIENSIQTDNPLNDWFASLNNLDNYVLFKELSYQSDLRGIIFSGSIGKPPIIDGRFFEESDFKKNEALAVVGSNYLESLKEINGIPYIELYHKSYKVIGVMGYNSKSRLDRICLVNMNSIPDNSFIEGLYILDGTHKKQINKNFVAFSNDLEIKHNKFITIISQSTNSITRFLSIKSLQIKLVFFFLMTVFIVSLSLSSYWYKSNQNEMNVMSLIGFIKYQILLSIANRFMRLILSTFLISVLLVSLFTILIAKLNYDIILNAILLSVIAILIISTCSLAIAILATSTQNTN